MASVGRLWFMRSVFMSAISSFPLGFAGLGTKAQGGTRIYSVSGHVVRPGIVEAPVSITLRSLIYDECGGIANGRQLKAVVPGGSSAAILTPDEIDIPMDVDGPRSKGSMIGSAGVIVMDDTVSIPEAFAKLLREDIARYAEAVRISGAKAE